MANGPAMGGAYSEELLQLYIGKGVKLLLAGNDLPMLTNARAPTRPGCGRCRRRGQRRSRLRATGGRRVKLRLFQP
jgi:hypothetical protein